MTVAFFGFLQSRELFDLTWKDIHRGGDGFRVAIQASKTDPFKHGAMVELKPSRDDTLCTVQALAKSPGHQASLHVQQWPVGPTEATHQAPRQAQHGSGVWVATVNVERADPIRVDLDGLWL